MKRLRKFSYNCPVHGETDFSAKDGDCIACRTVSPRVAARHKGESTYIQHCAFHGDVAHSVSRGLCLTCFNTAGRPRVRDATEPSSDRAAARRKGAKTYAAECPLHGVTDHSVQHGKCLVCFNQTGYPRPASTNPSGVYHLNGKFHEAP